MSVQDMTGRRLGAYEISRMIGQGGMGSVYFADRVDGQFSKQVAIKLVTPDAADAESIERFRQERETLAALDHPNIVKLLDGGVTEDGLPYLVMDYVEGTPIDDYCVANSISLEARLQLFLQVCDAVQYAHRSLVVHRDIKPRNIIVTTEGMPKLLDFGIAKLIRRNAPAALESTQVFRTFTLEYASPEQVRTGPMTIAVDVYALGVLLYELLTSRWPYSLNTPSEIALAYAICEASPQLPSESLTREEPWRANRPEAPATVRQLAGDLDAIVLRAIAKTPAERYASVADFAADIRRHLSKRPVMARPQTRGYRLQRFVQRNTAAVTAATLAVTLAISGTVALAAESRRTERQRAIAERRFQDLKGLVGTFLFDVHDTLRDVPGSEPARAMIIGKSSLYLAWLSGEAKDDESLRIDLADAYIKLGMLKGARAAFEKARQIAEAFLEKHPGNARARRYQALAALHLGSTGDALKALQLLSAADPGNKDLHLDLAAAHEKRAGESRPGEESMQALRDAYEELGEVRRLDPQAVTAAVSQAALAVRIGDYRGATRDPKRAQSEYQRALDALANLDRPDALVLRQTAQQKLDAALEAQKPALAIRHPGNAIQQQHVAKPVQE